jgi:hypothetical protein
MVIYKLHRFGKMITICYHHLWIILIYCYHHRPTIWQRINISTIYYGTYPKKTQQGLVLPCNDNIIRRVIDARCLNLGDSNLYPLMAACRVIYWRLKARTQRLCTGSQSSIFKLFDPSTAANSPTGSCGQFQIP